MLQQLSLADRRLLTSLLLPVLHVVPIANHWLNQMPKTFQFGTNDHTAVTAAAAKPLLKFLWGVSFICAGTQFCIAFNFAAAQAVSESDKFCRQCGDIPSATWEHSAKFSAYIFSMNNYTYWTRYRLLRHAHMPTAIWQLRASVSYQSGVWYQLRCRVRCNCLLIDREEIKATHLLVFSCVCLICLCDLCSVLLDVSVYMQVRLQTWVNNLTPRQRPTTPSYRSPHLIRTWKILEK